MATQPLETALTRKQLAEATGTGPEAIRFYEERGLLPPPRRGPNGYRLYGEATVRRLHFIRSAKDLGFTLHEIRELLDLEEHGASRGELKAKTEQKLALIHRKIADLTTLAHALERLVASCDGTGPLEGCPIYEHIAHAPAPSCPHEK
jgi:DNA-binding transcriptional MerR regulator